MATKKAKTENAPKVSRLKKITTKEVIGAIAPHSVSEYTSLYIVYGIAAMRKAKSTQYGEYVEFIGQFRAIVAETGEIFESSKCILPQDAEDMVVGQMTGEGTFEFAFNVGVAPNERSPRGYAFICEPITEQATSSSLDRLAGQIANLLPA